MADDNKEEAEKLKQEGNAFFKVKEYQQAISKYQAAISLYPSCAVYYSNLCICHSRLERYKDLEASAIQCIAVDPKFVKGHYWLVVALKNLKKYKQAASKCDQALKAFPTNNDIKLLHSEVHSKLQSIFKGEKVQGNRTYSKLL